MREYWGTTTRSFSPIESTQIRCAVAQVAAVLPFYVLAPQPVFSPVAAWYGLPYPIMTGNANRTMCPQSWRIIRCHTSKESD